LALPIFDLFKFAAEAARGILGTGLDGVEDMVRITGVEVQTAKNMEMT
jgi:hypothetical protein